MTGSFTQGIKTAAQHRRNTEHRLTHDEDVSMIEGVLLEAGQIQPGDADGDREGGPA